MATSTNSSSSSLDLYEQNEIVLWFHDKIFRFHESNDMTSLAGSPEEVKAYLVGASAPSIVLLSTFIAWALLLWVLYFQPHRAGFLSGVPMISPSYSRLPAVVRSIFALVLIVLILSLIVMLSSALPKVDKAATVVYSGVDAIDTVATEQLNILDQMQTIGDTIIPLKIFLASNLTNYCPSGDLASFFGDQSNYTSVEKAIDDFQNILSDELPYYRQLLSSLQGISSKALQASPLLLKLTLTFLYCMPLMLFSGVFVFGIVQAWRNISPFPFQSAQKKVVLPFFSLWIALSCLLTCLLLVYSIINAGTYANNAHLSDLVCCALVVLKKSIVFLRCRLLFWWWWKW